MVCGYSVVVTKCSANTTAQSDYIDDEEDDDEGDEDAVLNML